MKSIHYIILTLLFVCSTTYLKAQTISFADENFKNALIAQGYDLNGDGNIQKSEVANVKKLYIGKSSITSLTGIKNFTSLEEFGFFDNKLKTADFEGMRNLKFIYGFNNQITLLKLKGCIKLEGLYMDNNQLSFIDLSGLTSLIEVEINWNNLQSIDVGNKPKLEKVWLFDNQIYEFKANGSLALKDLKLNKNLIQEIDLRPFGKLVSLDLADNPLRKINVTGLSALETLNCEGTRRTSYLTQLNTCGLVSLKECRW